MSGESRSQFTFYASFRESVRLIKKAADRAAAYDAICDYALYGTEPDLAKLPDSAAIVFIAAKPNLDASKRKAIAGKKGGERKQAVSKTEANGKQDASKPKARANCKRGETASEKEKENEREIEKENECCYPPTPLAGGDNNDNNGEFGIVMSAYMDKVQATPSQMAVTGLKHYTEGMGSGVVLWAIETALDANKASWNYIRAILADKERRGVKSLADLQALESERGRRGASGNESGKYDFLGGSSTI